MTGQWYFVVIVLMIVNSMLAVADEPLGGIPDDAELDEYGFLPEDYTSSRVNMLTPEQLNTAILDGRITDFSFIENAKIQETMVQYPHLWKEEDLANHIGTRIEKDVAFINDAEQFKTAWFDTFSVQCSGCKIGQFFLDDNRVSTIDATKLASAASAVEAAAVVSFSLDELQNVEILDNGQLKIDDGSTIGNAQIFVDKKQGLANLLQLTSHVVDVKLGDVDTSYVYQISGLGKAEIADGVFVTGRKVLISIENGRHLISSLSTVPVELRYAKTSGYYAHRKESEKSVIPYAFTGVISFEKKDIIITREKEQIQNLRFAHLSLGENTKLYDFNTGNMVDVTKPTEYYHSPEGVFPRDKNYLRCRTGVNCIEYYVDQSQFGGVMRVHAADNNNIKINLINLETREDVRYKSFQEKSKREIDLELATLFVGTIDDDSTVTVNDNSKVVLEFSRNLPMVQGKLTDRTINVIESEIIIEENVVEVEQIDGISEELLSKEVLTQRFRINENGIVGICAGQECVEQGLFSAEKMELTPAEISERLYLTAYRYVLCSAVSEECGAGYGGLGFTAGSRSPALKELRSSKKQWVTTCIGLTKASLSPGVEEGLSEEITERVRKGDKYADTGFFVQSYLRDEVPGFKSTYIVVEENSNYFEDVREGEGRVLYLVQQQMKKGENIEIIVVESESDRSAILAAIPRGSLVTEPVNGHDYVHAGIDSFSGNPTTYEAHVGTNQISRDVNANIGVPILITYDEKASRLNAQDVQQNGGTVFRYDGTEIKAAGPKAGIIEKRINDLVAAYRKESLEKQRERREFEQLVTQ
ncbi:MAG: hypothetical protein Q8R37_02485 [Nanoarchaeota archaeon]|nr:hypothetical protein [Nanoarchaeota archaeon]